MARNHNQIGQSYSSEDGYNNENVIGGDRVTDSVVTTNRKKETNDDRDGCRNSSTTNIVPNSISSVRREIESERIKGNKTVRGESKENCKKGDGAQSKQFTLNINARPIFNIATYGNILADYLILTITQSDNGNSKFLPKEYFITKKQHTNEKKNTNKEE